MSMEKRVQFTLNSSTCMVRFVVYPHQYPPLTSAESISTLALHSHVSKGTHLAS